jgi:hypothetical protein
MRVALTRGTRGVVRFFHGSLPEPDKPELFKESGPELDLQGKLSKRECGLQNSSTLRGISYNAHNGDSRFKCQRKSGGSY